MPEGPLYFEKIRQHASERWDLLERDPELAGPWHQLFKQVQSPRHVVSELLQNADDAGAKQASVKIEDGFFIFTHDGEDFTEEHFRSLCRFGYSNKRALHTIGFRGIGFKSVFSIGDTIHLTTPSLSVQFNRQRFTEPIWRSLNERVFKTTEIRVKIRDEQRYRELEKNLDDWKKSPVSLLFFRSLRSLTIQGHLIEWKIISSGPVKNSDWITLSNNPETKYLMIQSDPESFPDNALEEIRDERMVSIDEETSFPPCTIELVLGFEGRLFVILPTGVKTSLPFACNAPFIQDPARVKIKDPEISPTNRWLLKRIGRLAAKVMESWLNRIDWNAEKRCDAYRLLPDKTSDDGSIKNSCGKIVADECAYYLRNKNFILTDAETLEGVKRCTGVPKELFDIWQNETIEKYFLSNGKILVSRKVAGNYRRKLIDWNFCDEIDKDFVLKQLRFYQLPKPISWSRLLTLWNYISDVMSGYRFFSYRRSINILPVKGKDILFPVDKVIRLGEKKLLRSIEDWQFLDDYLLVLNQNWPRYLTKKKRQSVIDSDRSTEWKVSSSQKIFKELKLDQPSDINQVIEQVAEGYFKNGTKYTEDCVRLTQIAAKLSASVSDSFMFITVDGRLKPAKDIVVFDMDKNLDLFVPEGWYQEHVLHPAYENLISCTTEEWAQWIESGKGNIYSFIPVVQKEKHIYNKNKILEFLNIRGNEQNPNFSYQRDDFTIYDWDFDDDLWNHWKFLSKEDENIWSRILSRIFLKPKENFGKTLYAKAYHNGRKYRKPLTKKTLLASWILKFRNLPCLKDTYGLERQPSELLLRTPETESLLDVESFVRPEDDNENTKEFLLAIGVRDTPTGPERLLERLRALSKSEETYVYEVEKWCNRLDRLASRCSTEEFQKIKTAFTKNKIILSSDQVWMKADEIFLNLNKMDVPGAAIVHPAICNLSLWCKIGVSEQPTIELSIKWLKGIQSNNKISKEQQRRIRPLIPLYAKKIWNDCKHWISLNGEWVPIDQIAYKLTMQSLVPWGNLFENIKQKTADLQQLNADTCNQQPFLELPTLAEVIEYRFENQIASVETDKSKVWISALGKGFSRILLDDQDEKKEIRSLGERLLNTQWCVVEKIETTPYIDGVPAGTPRLIEALWKEEVLYVMDKPIGKMAKAIAQELGRHFKRLDIIDAIKICFERGVGFVDDYLMENFNLESVEEIGFDVKKKSPTTANNEALDKQEMSLPEETPEQISSSEFEDKQKNDAETETESPDSYEIKKIKKRKSSPSFFEIFAESQGFMKHDTEMVFIHENGSRIEKNNENSFPWELFSPAGNLIQRYWAKKHCIEREPLKIDADIWSYCNSYPDRCSFIFTTTDGVPIEYSGEQINKFKKNGKVKLFPASYRLVWEVDNALD